jgi:signal transduction histidine kinase
LQECITEIRSLSRRLSAPTLGKINLEESVNDLIQSINLSSKIKIRQEISGFENNSLHKELHVGVYRILQEQLNNVLKHADASEVLVELKRCEDQIHLSVKDNGKGFSVHRPGTGIGLMNMQTRAENLNGSFFITTKPGCGCEVKVILPCTKNVN